MTLRIVLLSALAAAVGASAQRPAPPPVADAAARCRAIATIAWPEATRVKTATMQPAGGALPAHCEVIGVLHERVGVDGQPYAIKVHLRLPERWNGRFLFQGGAGTNGVIGDATGPVSPVAPPALAQGYAVLSQDSGHDNAVDTAPARNGASAFGFDPQARTDYGGASLEPATRAALAAIRGFYGRDPEHRYFVGCSKGGQEGMMLAQRYPDLFDGIVAAAPGFSLPRAAVAEAWDTQSFARVAAADGLPLTPAGLAATFSADDTKLVGQAILAACDADDGLVDGMIGAFGRCTSAKVLPALARITCAGAKRAGCLSAAQVEALRRTHDGARTSRGKPLYAGFPWDAGWAAPGWRAWKIGAADGKVPAINVLMGAPSLAAVFTVPPTALAPGVQASLDYARGFDMDRDARAIDATSHAFPRSGWQDVGARSPDLAAFARHGGRMIVPQGVSDPVFSIGDTIAWYGEVDRLSGGRAAATVRLFAVPGMNHCGGGPATDGFDAFAALVRWVEAGAAPERIVATAGPASPWPGRSRPLCAFPREAHYRGSGDKESADSFVCR